MSARTWEDEDGREYRIVQIASPRFVVERDDGQVVSDADGTTKIFFDPLHAEFYLDSYIGHRS